MQKDKHLEKTEFLRNILRKIVKNLLKQNVVEKIKGKELADDVVSAAGR